MVAVKKNRKLEKHSLLTSSVALGKPLDHPLNLANFLKSIQPRHQKVIGKSIAPKYLVILFMIFLLITS